MPEGWHPQSNSYYDILQEEDRWEALRGARSAPGTKAWRKQGLGVTPRLSPPSTDPAVPDPHRELGCAAGVMCAGSYEHGTCDRGPQETHHPQGKGCFKEGPEPGSDITAWTMMEHSLGNPGNQVPSLWHEWPSRSVVQSFEETMDLRCFPRSRGPDLGQPRTQPRYRQWISPRHDSPAHFRPRVLKNDSAFRTPQRKNSSGVHTIQAGRPEGDPSATTQPSAPAEPSPAKQAAAEEPGAFPHPEKPAPMSPVPSSGPGQVLSSPEIEEPGGVSSAPSGAAVRTMDAGMLKTIVHQLVPAQQRGDPFLVPAFLQIYKRFTTTHQVLDLLLQRYHNFQEGNKDEDCKEALCSLLETWLQHSPGHFYEAHDLSCLKKLATYAWTQMPYSDLEFQALELLTQLVNEDQYEELVAELEAKAEPEAAAPQPEPQEPSLPQAAHPPAIEVLQPTKGPTTEPDCKPNKAQGHPVHVLCAPNLSTASQLGMLEAGMVQKHMNLLPAAQQTGTILCRFTGTHRVLCLLFPRAFCCLVGTGLDWCLTYIHQPQHQASQNPLMMYHRPNMPLSYVALRVYLLLSQIEDQEPKEAEPEPQGLTNDSVPTAAALLQPQAPAPALGSPGFPGAETQRERPRGKTTRWPWSRLRLPWPNHSQGHAQHRLPGWARTLAACFCIQRSGQSQG